MNNTKIVEWVLRIGVAGEFLGHGVFALQQKEGWVGYFEAVGISAETALPLMTLIGVLDLTVATVVLVRPINAVLLWAVFWDSRQP